MREPVVILPPDGRREQDVLRRDRGAPRHVVLADVQPLGVLVEHRVDDVRERLVGVEEPVPAGEEVALEPSEQRVLRQHLHDAAVAATARRRRRPPAAGRPSTFSCWRRRPPAAGSRRSRPDRRRGSWSGCSPSRRAGTRRAAWCSRIRTCRATHTSTAYLRKSGSLSSLRSRPPLACGLALIRRCPRGASARSSGTSAAVRRRTAPPACSCASSSSSSFRFAGLFRTSANGTWCERHEPSTLCPLISFGPVHPFGERSTIIGQRGRLGVFESRAAFCARTNLADRPLQRGRHLAGASRRIAAFDEIRRVAVADEQRFQLLVADARTGSSGFAIL